MDLPSLFRFVPLALGAMAAVAGIAIHMQAKRKRGQAVEQALTRGDRTLLTDSEARFEGLKSGRAEMSRGRRGRGALILTDRMVIYEEFLPTYKLEITFKQIRAVETSATFLGKQRGSTVLILHFTDSHGQVADVGFSPINPDSWAMQIRRLIS
ncbi:MAG: hypothetical protein O7H41_02095 [Planctomycetota bacterium]|nr:hypothetical protein [Planctomycetota bacterium]